MDVRRRVQVPDTQGLSRWVWSLSASWTLSALGMLGLFGCQGECVQVCDRMASVFARCGQPVSDAELNACRVEQAQASDVEERLCSGQTSVVLEENLRIRGGGASPCDALAEYGDAKE